MVLWLVRVLHVRWSDCTISCVCSWRRLGAVNRSTVDWCSTCYDTRRRTAVNGRCWSTLSTSTASCPRSASWRRGAPRTHDDFVSSPTTRSHTCTHALLLVVVVVVVAVAVVAVAAAAAAAVPLPPHPFYGPFLRDHPGEPVPEENFWTLWCKERLTEADTLTIRLGATPSRLTSAHLHHPPLFYRPDALPAQPTVSVHWRQLAHSD